ncbi:MAG TPA: O-acetyl-ADP-ribose deacetylase [Pyrinomonadaceae bacterium]|jgi:O-acetyl-ADP-ribose deacetylase (regulator of RNase III)
MLTEFFSGRVAVAVGDITREEVDAVVNAANSTLLGGGGVDGAIHRAGGARILEECREIRRTRFPDGLPAGKAVITSGGNLAARFVIHTVGPVYGMNQGTDAGLLADCYRNSLQLAAENNLETIAFPAISTGAFAYPPDEAARVSSQAIKNFLEDNQTIKQVRLVFFSANDAAKFVKHQVFGE